MKDAGSTILAVWEKVKPRNFAEVCVLAVLGGVVIWTGWEASGRVGNSLDRYGNDFTVFLAAAQQLRTTGNPYAHPLAGQWPYLYPPLFAELIVPLTFLSLRGAAFVWALVNEGATLGILAIALRRLAGGWDRSRTIVVGAVWFAVVWRIVGGNLFLGQVNLVIAFLCLVAVDQADRRPGPAGAALALAASIKLTPAVLLLFLVSRARWRALGWTIAWGGLMNAASLCPLGHRGVAVIGDWFQTVVVEGWKFNWATASNQSLRGMVLRFFAGGMTDVPGLERVILFDLGPNGALVLWIACALIVLGGCAWGWLRTREVGPELGFGSNAVALCAVPLASSLAWEVHFASALPLAAWWCARSVTTRDGWAIGSAVLFFFTFGLGRGMLARWNAPLLEAFSLTTVATLMGMAVAIHRMRRIQDG